MDTRPLPIRSSLEQYQRLKISSKPTDDSEALRHIKDDYP